MKLKNETFVFEVSLDAVPHNKETAEEIYGKNAYESGKFGVEAHAAEWLSQVFQDAYAHNMKCITRHLVECKCDPEQMTEAQRRHHDYLERKVGITEKVWHSMKFTRVDKNS